MLEEYPIGRDISWPKITHNIAKVLIPLSTFSLDPGLYTNILLVCWMEKT